MEIKKCGTQVSYQAAMVNETQGEVLNDNLRKPPVQQRVAYFVS